jgi:hypothetical protein
MRATMSSKNDPPKKDKEKEREKEKDKEEPQKKCSYGGCRKPVGCSRYHHIEGSSKAGQQDWTSLAGQTLCDACYCKFLNNGNLERAHTQHGTLAPSARRCSYAGCKRPDSSSRFLQVDGSSKAGGHDWSPIAGYVLCNSCYTLYAKKGRLNRIQTQHGPLTDENKRCKNESCKNPEKSSRFFLIDGTSKAGGHDWSALSGTVLCDACYCRYLNRGTLQRRQQDPLSAEQRRCTNSQCEKPDESSRFLKINGGSKAGGQDWTSLQGEVLCNSCYTRYKNRGTLDRARQAHIEPAAAVAKKRPNEGLKPEANKVQKKAKGAFDTSPDAPVPAPERAPAAPVAPATPSVPVTVVATQV